MELSNIKRVYLVGIGGIGMSGLARYFHHLGYVVCGYDKTSTDLNKRGCTTKAYRLFLMTAKIGYR